MKPSIKFGLISVIVCLFLLSTISTIKLTKNDKKIANKQIHFVSDHNKFESNINHVIRRDPTITTVTNLSANRLQAPTNIISTSNSNTSNAPNIGFFGKTAETVGKYLSL
jgi:hypothetical protein